MRPRILGRLRGHLERPRSRGRVLVFSQPRCGSSTLALLLESHPELTIFSEPFNPNTAPHPEFAPVRSHAELRRRLEWLWERYSGLKHVWTAWGWPFLGEVDLHDYLLRNAAESVIFMNRRNLLRQLVSNQMALQSRAFHRETAGGSAEEEERARSHEYAPIAGSDLEKALGAIPIRVEHYREVLERSRRPHLEVWYEDLLGELVDSDGRWRGIGEIYRLLGLSLEDEGVDRERVAQLLDPEVARMNDPETYRRVPGIDEIEARFGCDETGWLFR